MTSRNMVAHYLGGTSDKIYMACVRDNGDGTFSVIGKWGRRGSIKQAAVKATLNSLIAAEANQLQLFREKLTEGYKDIDSSLYTGLVNRMTPCVVENLEPEFGQVSRSPATQKSPPEGNAGDGHEPVAPTPVITPMVLEDDGVVVCVDNVGMEDKFDTSIEYVAEPHKDDTMIWVYDKFGNRGEYFRQRFVSLTEYNRRKENRFYQPKPGETLTVRILKKRGEVLK